MRRERGANGTLAILVCAMVLAGGIAASTAPAAVGATTCRVRNVTQHTAGRSLISMVEKAVDGDELRARGTCPGQVIIDVDIVVRGMGDVAVVTGRSQVRAVKIVRRATVTLRGLAIRRGGDVSVAVGGGISNNGRLTLVDSIVRAGRASYGGGGVGNYRRLTIIDSTVSGNRGGSGGGIYNTGRLTIIDSSISGNRGENGGGIANNYGAATLNLSGSMVSGNTAAEAGGGIWNGHGSVTLDGASSVTDNHPDDCVGTPAC